MLDLPQRLPVYPGAHAGHSPDTWSHASSLRQLQNDSQSVPYLPSSQSEIIISTDAGNHKDDFFEKSRPMVQVSAHIVPS